MAMIRAAAMMATAFWVAAAGWSLLDDFLVDVSATRRGGIPSIFTRDLKFNVFIFPNSNTSYKYSYGARLSKMRALFLPRFVLHVSLHWSTFQTAGSSAGRSGKRDA